MSDVTELLERAAALKAARAQWEALWQELAEVLDPGRASFTVARVPGERLHDKTYDSTPMLARRGLVAGLGGLLRPKTIKWFEIEALDEALNGEDDNRAWLQDASERLWNAIYNRKAKFIERAGQTDNELITFGTGGLFVGESRQLSGFLFRNIPLKNLYLDLNEDGDVDTAFVLSMLTPRQAIQRYGEDKLSARTRELARDPKAKAAPFWQAILPRAERDIRKRDDRNMAFASVHIDAAAEHKIGEGGYHEFPIAVPRWDTNADEVYGRSIGMLALPDAATLQAMGKTLLVAGQKAVEPPLVTVDDAIIGQARTFPGGITYTDGAAWKDLGGREPVRPLTTGANIPLGREMQNDTREQIWRAFFRNVLNLPVDGPQMTAFEVATRKEEFIREIGPVLESQESNYLAPVVERGFAIMERAGAFPPRPERLRDRGLRFKFRSPVEQVRKQIEAAATSQGLDTLSPFIAAQQDAMDNFDVDRMVRDLPAIYGTPQRYLRPVEEVEALRRRRQEQAVAQLAGQQLASPEAQAALASPEVQAALASPEAQEGLDALVSS